MAKSKPVRNSQKKIEENKSPKKRRRDKKFSTKRKSVSKNKVTSKKSSPIQISQKSKKSTRSTIKENNGVKREFKKTFKERSLWENIEYYNEHLIPFAVVLLLVIIIVELFVEIHSHSIEQLIHMGDYFVIAVFVIDLIFIFRRCHGLRFFFRYYWLDILAVFPFIFLFRAVGSLFRLFLASERFLFGQTILHESLELRKATMASRVQKAGRFSRMIARFIRVVTKTRFFQKFKNPKKRY